MPWYSDTLPMAVDSASATALMKLWRDLPILSRDTVQANSARLTSSKLPKDHGTTSSVVSSGSTGKPVTVTVTELTNLFFDAINLRVPLWHNLDVNAVVAGIRVLRGDENDAAASDKPVGWVAGHQSGPMYLFDVTRPVREQLAWLERIKPKYLLTLPTNLDALIRYTGSEGVSCTYLRGVMTMSEAIAEGLHDRCMASWGIPVWDVYSAVETGLMALQCPETRHYHVQSEHVYVEILRDNGEPCDTGETGRVVVTDLHNFVMPLIRYDIGDYAQIGEMCACGRGLPVIDRIVGRARNMVCYPNGDQAWPLPWLSREMLDIAPVQQIQIIQHSVHDLEVKLVVDNPLSKDAEEAMCAMLTRHLHHEFCYQFSYVGDIPRSTGGKFEEFISHVKS